MLCSARELKLARTMGPARTGRRRCRRADIREHLLLDDTLFTLKLTPNLGTA